MVLAVLMLLSSCGKAGDIYGSLDWQYYCYGSIGGFPPPNTIVRNAEYKVDEGTYEVKYINYDGTYYYPGGYDYPSSYYDSYYTVAENKGGFLSDGKDNHFHLYLSIYGLVKSGDARALVPNQIWTENGLTISVTNKVVPLTPEISKELVPLAK